MGDKITLELTRAEVLMIQRMAYDSDYGYRWMEAIKDSLSAKAAKACRKQLMPTGVYKRRLKAVRKLYRGEVIEEEMVQAEANEIKFFYEVAEDCYIEEECSEPGGILYSIAEATEWLSGMVKKNKEWQANKCFNGRIEVINGPEPMKLQIYENIDELAELLGAELTCKGRLDGKEELSFLYEGCKVFQIREELSFERLLSDIT